MVCWRGKHRKGKAWYGFVRSSGIVMVLTEEFLEPHTHVLLWTLKFKSHSEANCWVHVLKSGRIVYDCINTAVFTCSAVVCIQYATTLDKASGEGVSDSLCKVIFLEFHWPLMYLLIQTRRIEFLGVLKQHALYHPLHAMPLPSSLGGVWDMSPPSFGRGSGTCLLHPLGGGLGHVPSIFWEGSGTCPLHPLGGVWDMSPPSFGRGLGHVSSILWVGVWDMSPPSFGRGSGTCPLHPLGGGLGHVPSILWEGVWDMSPPSFGRGSGTCPLHPLGGGLGHVPSILWEGVWDMSPPSFGRGSGTYPLHPLGGFWATCHSLFLLVFSPSRLVTTWERRLWTIPSLLLSPLEAAYWRWYKFPPLFLPVTTGATPWLCSYFSLTFFFVWLCVCFLAETTVDAAKDASSFEEFKGKIGVDLEVFEFPDSFIEELWTCIKAIKDAPREN